MRDNHLSKVFNLDKWQEVQDAIAVSTKFAIITVDFKGDPVTKHSCCSRFCEKIRRDPTLSSYCRRCDSRGGLEAVRLNNAYIYLCHFDIVDIAIPIIINNNYAGAILAGQVRLATPHNLERIMTKPDGLEKCIPPELLALRDELPTLTYDEILIATDAIHKLANYIIEESLNKNLLIDMYERIFKNEKLNAGIEIMQKEALPTITNTCSNTAKDSAILRPAISYMNNHISSGISVAELAKICNISEGYLIRLFKHTTGETVTQYHNKLKINAACDMLTNSEMSIHAISDALGFSDPSYFNRVFKKHRNISPAIYRKFNSNV